MTPCICSQNLVAIETIDDINRRCEITTKILRSCALIRRSDWDQLMLCRECGQFWIVSRPYSELHGGGPACAYAVGSDELPSGDPFRDILRRTQEERFLSQLGPEAGPEYCRAVGCDHLRIRHSIFCVRHHTEAIKRIDAREKSRAAFELTNVDMESLPAQRRKLLAFALLFAVIAITIAGAAALVYWPR